MSIGNCASDWAPSSANQTRRSAARRPRSSTGSTWPVVQVTWLTKIARVRGVSRARTLATVPAGARRSGSNVRTTMPTVFILWSSGMASATCSCVEAMISSPAFKGSPFRMMLMPSVAVLTSAISAGAAAGPSNAAHFPRIRVQSASLWPGLGDSSSRSMAAFTRSLTALGQAPRPAVLK